MPGRGDNNKHGSAERGSSNQSNQPFVNTEGESASNHSRMQTGGNPSIPQPKTTTPDADRNQGSADRKLRPIQMHERDFNLMVDSVPYLVHISINGGDQHVFTWDSEVGGLRAIDDAAASLPVAVEEEISARLQSGKG